MAGRTVARSSASRDQPSSPTKPNKRVNISQSPTRNMSRTTRSASRELGESEVGVRTRKKRSQAVREGSAESAGSAASVDDRSGRKRKNARPAMAAASDLSMVAEEQDKEQVGENVNNSAKVTQSPGGMSNLSGTTARTSQSEQKMADLDAGMIMELIPDLFREAFQLLDLLIPQKASPELVGAIIKELQVPGSGRGKRLRHRERTFDSTRENYGSDLFISPTLILGKLFGNEEPEPGDFRPDVILHAANIAVLVKELLVAQRDNPNTMDLLQYIYDALPTCFLSGFEAEPKLGTSALFEPTVKLALDLRTQTSIALFKVYRDETNIDRDEVLAALFYEPPAQRDESLSRYEDIITNGQCRRMGGIGAEALPLIERKILDRQSDEILERVESIRETFSAEGNGNIDYVDFDKLHNQFPWNSFLASLVQWCQLRLAEINKSIEAQRGVDNITRLLIEKIKSLDNQIELYYEPPKAAQPPREVTKNKSGLLPAVNIIPASAGKSFYNSSKSLQALLKRLTPGSSAPPSYQQHPAAPLRDNPTAEGRSAQPQTISNQEPVRNVFDHTVADMASLMDDQWLDEDDISDSGKSSIAEVISLHFEGETHNHKENWPINLKDDSKVRKLRFVDRQPNAERVTWSQDGDEDEIEPQTTYRKRRRQSIEDEVEEDDEAFEFDPRPIDQSRREQAISPVGQFRSQLQNTESSAKRARLEHREGTDRQRKEMEREEQEQNREIKIPATQERTSQTLSHDETLQASAETHDDAPTSSFAFIDELSETARAAMMKYRVPKGPRQRQMWSGEETETLMNLIEEIGCHWSQILKAGRGRFADSRDQVSLKDKARNLKVEFLVTGSILPRNFNGIALGKKEREKVKAARMNPYRLEGEAVGDESHDMDGRLIQDNIV